MPAIHELPYRNNLLSHIFTQSFLSAFFSPAHPQRSYTPLKSVQAKMLAGDRSARISEWNISLETRSHLCCRLSPLVEDGIRSEIVDNDDMVNKDVDRKIIEAVIFPSPALGVIFFTLYPIGDSLVGVLKYYPKYKHLILYIHCYIVLVKWLGYQFLRLMMPYVFKIIRSIDW